MRKASSEKQRCFKGDKLVLRVGDRAEQGTRPWSSAGYGMVSGKNGGDSHAGLREPLLFYFCL
jgi:hypothetical protein